MMLNGANSPTLRVSAGTPFDFYLLFDEVGASTMDGTAGECMISVHPLGRGDEEHLLSGSRDVSFSRDYPRDHHIHDGHSPSPLKEATNGPAYPMKIEFTFSKPSGNPQTTNVQVTFINLSPNTFTGFVFQAAVPKFLQLHLDPASSNTLPASGNITQNLRVTNSQHGKKSLVMRMRIEYKVNGDDVLEEGQINNFPRGL